METGDDDSNLIEGFFEDEIKSFDLIYEKYSRKIFAFSLKYLKSVEDAEDSVQQTFLKLWEIRYKLRKTSSLKSLLFTITYNNICNIYRKRSYQKQYIDEILSEDDSSYSYNPYEKINYDSVLCIVKRLLEKLPEKQKLAFKKSREEGKSAKEIAKELDLSRETVDNYISSTIKYIRNNLEYGKFAILLIILDLLN